MKTNIIFIMFFLSFPVYIFSQNSVTPDWVNKKVFIENKVVFL